MDLIPIYIVVTFLILFALLIILRKAKQDKDTDDDLDTSQNSTGNSSSGNDSTNTESNINAKYIEATQPDRLKKTIADNNILSCKPYYLAELSFNTKLQKHYFKILEYPSMSLHGTEICEEIFLYSGVKFFGSGSTELDPSKITDWKEFTSFEFDNSCTHKWYDDGRITNFRVLGFPMSLPLHTNWVKFESLDGKIAYAHLFQNIYINAC